MNQHTAVPVLAPPAFVEKAKSEFEALLKARPDLVHVDAVLADLGGVLRGKRMPVREALRLFTSGMQIPYTIYLMDANGEMTNPFGKGFGDGDPDGTAWPIPGTISPVWSEGEPRAQMLMTLRDEKGVATAGEPRAMLETVLEQFRKLKLRPVAALELEFYLIDPQRDGRGHPQPPMNPRGGARESTASVYGMEDLDRYAKFLTSLRDAAALQNVPLSATSKEYAPGQFEANLKHQTDAIFAADHAVFLKQIVKATARASGYDATFMAKPYPDKSGSGLHIHVSLIDESGKNVFDDGTPGGSETLRHAIGGLQALMPESMMLFAPSINSFRRFEPDMFAPVNRRWGINNRSAGLRVPVGPNDARRVEHRVAGADANPYLTLAAVLAGVLHGLNRKLDPGAPATTNVSREPDRTLPFNIDDAITRLENAQMLPAFLGEESLALYRESKRIEVERFRKIVSAAEFDWYL
ncbi:MAG TPA: glutamine synthetase family protein [Rhizomicrobium sp.]|jgi:glutamine synthetase|nr:glutamine synthetase family protein [Rhizomicrobium sp.]